MQYRVNVFVSAQKRTFWTDSGAKIQAEVSKGFVPDSDFLDYELPGFEEGFPGII